RYIVVSRSPLTNWWAHSSAGGFFGPELKYAGYDLLIIQGKASRPVYIYIDNDFIQIRDAKHLWGKTVPQTNRQIEEELGDKELKIATIGPAGENLNYIASIVFDGMISRQAARGGIGANMGSKNLKAIVVCRGVGGNRGKQIEIANRPKLQDLLKKQIPQIQENTKALHEFGTADGVVAVEAFGDLPIKNWQLGDWKEEVQKISGQKVRETIFEKHYACYSCPIGCGKIVRGELKGYGKFHGRYAEYESVGMLGANCLNSDLNLLSYCVELCNRYGLDTIHTGNVLAFAMECFEKGKITTASTDGLEIKWGDAKTMITLIHQIGRREGFGGKFLADGVINAAERLGKDTIDFAPATKRFDYPAHDPRGHVSMALNYATATRGACHLEGLTYFLDRGVKCPDLGYTTPPDQFTYDDKPQIVFNMQNLLSVFNPLGLCKFLLLGGVGPKIIANWCEVVCGWSSYTMEDLLKTGERLFNLKRMFNVKLGISSKDDKLPKRLLTPKPDGKAKGIVPQLDKMLREYYKLRGWSEKGIPKEEKLKELGL
ncbi:MAG: aldehyde ferredoxin oxidoreductase family protein, partial [Elusimicrobiota bacterium]|nr:aldehyde ferredoxin oxidoreductase family protein [Elusimicrobiota bacterium]